MTLGDESCARTATSAGRTRYIPKTTKDKVWQRDHGSCQRCGTKQKLEYERISIDPTKKENLSAEYTAKNPFGKVPVMENDGLVMFESAAICWHLAEKYRRLIPSDPVARHRI